MDNGKEYPGGNNHGSICEINGEWYIFYHRMTNGSIMSRRACVERIEIDVDGSIAEVEIILDIVGTGCNSVVEIYIDDMKKESLIGECRVGMDSKIYSSTLQSITGRHAIYLKVKSSYTDWSKEMFEGRHLFELKSLVFKK